MIITISGKAGSGKSTVAKMLAAKLGLKHYSIGDLMRERSQEKGISIIDINKLAETDKSIDKELDSKQIMLGKTQNNFVIDGRLTAYFIPNADLKIFLDAEDNVRAQRILKDRRKLEGNTNIKKAMSNIEKRELSEKKRYKEYYGVDYHNRKLYDYIIDTTNLSPQEVVDKVVEIVKKIKYF